MRLWDDERAQSIQVGAVLLFAVLIIAFSSYQAFVVPNQNREVEFNHNQQVHDEMLDLRNGVVSSAGGNTGRSTSVTLGTTYPSRLVALNPGPASGTLRTVGTSNGSVAVAIDNATATGDTGDVWDGTERSYSTGGIVYSPSYNLYTNSPRTIYEHSVLYNEFRSGTVVLANQTMIEGNRISLVTVNGSIDRGGRSATTVDVRAVSTSERTVRISDDGGDPVTITFASRLSVSRWETLLGGEDNVVDVREASTSVPAEFTAVTVELATGVDYRLQMTKVGVGTKVTDEDVTYLTNVTRSPKSVLNGESADIVVEARDPYNNPVQDVTVNATTDDGALDSTTVTTGDDGRATVTFDGSAVDPGTYDVNLSLRAIDDGYATSGVENVTVEVEVADLQRGSYSLAWDRSRIATQSGVACTDQNCSININATSSADLYVATDPDLDGVLVDYSIDSRSPASISPETGETFDGANSTTLTEQGASDGDELNVYATSGGGTDTLPIVFETGAFFDVTIDETNRPVNEGDVLKVNGTVENTGSETATEDVEFYFDDSLEGENVDVTLDSGDLATFNFTYDTTGETTEGHTVEVRSSESQDSATRTVDVIGDVPYFTVSDFTAPNQAYEGETITVSATVENTGTASGTQTVEYRIGGTTPNSETVTLDPGQSTTVTYDYTIQESANTYTHGYYSENDSDTATITVQEVPDSSRVVYLDSSTGDLSTVTLVGTGETYGVSSPGGIGPKRADIAGGPGTDIPFENAANNGYLRAVEDDESLSTLDNTDVDQAPMGVGDWDDDGTIETVYVRGGLLYEVASGTSPNELTYSVNGGSYDCNNGQSPCSVDAQSVGGIADITGDGANEIVYVDADNSDLAYFDGSDETPIVTGLSSGTGVSTPADFDGDGTVRVAVEDGAGGITLYDVDGNALNPSSSPDGTVAQSPMAAADWNDDGTLDVVYVDSNGDLRYWDPANGDSGYVTDQDGTPISADSNIGAR